VKLKAVPHMHGCFLPVSAASRPLSHISSTLASPAATSVLNGKLAGTLAVERQVEEKATRNAASTMWTIFHHLGEDSIMSRRLKFVRPVAAAWQPVHVAVVLQNTT
jgi:hypothetical protein